MNHGYRWARNTFIMGVISINSCAMPPTPQKTEATGVSDVASESATSGDVTAQNQLRKVRLAVLTQEQSEDFLQRVGQRHISAERSPVLVGIVAEKEDILKRLDLAIDKEYGVKSGKAYQLDEAGKRLVEKVEGQPGGVAHEFASEELMLKFRRVWEARANLITQLQALKQIDEEVKRSELAVNQYLLKTYKVEPTLNYHYDNATRTIYLLLAPESIAP